jgi:hypothetical protein
LTIVETGILPAVPLTMRNARLRRSWSDKRINSNMYNGIYILR